MFPKCFALATLPATVLRVYPFNNARKRKWRKNKNLQTLTRPRTKTSAEKRILRIRPVSTLVDVPTLVGRRASERGLVCEREALTLTHTDRETDTDPIQTYSFYTFISSFNSQLYTKFQLFVECIICVVAMGRQRPCCCYRW